MKILQPESKRGLTPIYGQWNDKKDDILDIKLLLDEVMRDHTLVIKEFSPDLREEVFSPTSVSKMIQNLLFKNKSKDSRKKLLRIAALAIEGAKNAG